MKVTDFILQKKIRIFEKSNFYSPAGLFPVRCSAAPLNSNHWVHIFPQKKRLTAPNFCQLWSDARFLSSQHPFKILDLHCVHLETIANLDDRSRILEVWKSLKQNANSQNFSIQKFLFEVHVSIFGSIRSFLGQRLARSAEMSAHFWRSNFMDRKVIDFAWSFYV